MRRGVLLAALGVLLSARIVGGDEVGDALAGARRALDGGRREEAMETVRRLVADHPGDHRPIPLLAFLLVDSPSGPGEAIELLADYLDRRPGDPYGLELLTACAERALSEGDPELARLAAKILLLQRGERKEDLYLWAEASFRMGQSDSVTEATRRLIASWPSFEPPYWLLSKVLEEEGRLADAADVYRDLLREQSGNVRARLTRAGLLLWGLRRYDEAEGEYLSALEISEPGSSLRADVEAGLRAVREERERSGRLRTQSRLINRMLAISIIGWTVLVTILASLLRRHPSSPSA
jgi:predicted Zn-dependent protease